MHETIAIYRNEKNENIPNLPRRQCFGLSIGLRQQTNIFEGR